MSWHEECNNFDSRIEASSKDASFNDTEFLLIQDDAEDPAGDKVYANKAVLALISPVFYAQFYGPFSSNQIPLSSDQNTFSSNVRSLSSKGDTLSSNQSPFTSNGSSLSSNQSLISSKQSPISSNQPPPIEDGTARGFKQLLKFICNPISFNLPDDVVQVFEISYFAHKYQIGSLVSQCRQLLGTLNFSEGVKERSWRGKELDILNWALSSEQGANVKKMLTQEHQLLVNRLWVQIEENFEEIFPNGKINEDQALLDEDLMLKILARKDLGEEEHLIFMVAINYYKKRIEKGQLLDDRKRFKKDIETEWNETLEKLKSVMVFEKINPDMFAELLEKIVKLVPGTMISNIAEIISPFWKSRDFYDRQSEGRRCCRSGALEDISFKLDINDDDWINDDQLNSSAQIVFKTNQDAIFEFCEYSMFNGYDTEDFFDLPIERVNCCVEDTIKLQNEGHYRDEMSYRRAKDNKLDCGDPFYVEANKKVTITYERKCKRSCCLLRLHKLEQFSFSKEGFSMEIVEVNGQPVSGPCYTFFNRFAFTRL